MEIRAGLLHGQVLQLHGADGFLLEGQRHGVGEVARVVVLLPAFRRDDAGGQVVGLDDADARDFRDEGVAVRTGPVPVLVQGLGELGQQVILRRAKQHGAVPLHDVLLVPRLGASEEGFGKGLAISLHVGPGVDDGTAGFVVDDAVGAGGLHGHAHGLLVEGHGKGLTELAGVFLPHVVVVLGVFEVVDGHVGDEQVVDVDDALVGGNLVAAEDGGAGHVVAGGRLAQHGEAGALAVVDGADAVQVFHHVGLGKGGHHLAGKDLHEHGVNVAGLVHLTGTRHDEVGISH